MPRSGEQPYLGGTSCCGKRSLSPLGHLGRHRAGRGSCSWLVSWAHTLLFSSSAPSSCLGPSGWSQARPSLVPALRPSSGRPGLVTVRSELRAELGQEKPPHFPRPLHWFPSKQGQEAAGNLKSCWAQQRHFLPVSVSQSRGDHAPLRPLAASPSGSSGSFKPMSLMKPTFIA